ncbi:hypothetical protein [Nocardia jiangxiensis]|uniref:hypothetical protein n=1 Tax=Nocardia jiangxiensis TaxID=282685 RepID=UPI0012F6AE2A|nr:hypothetical protein [Nocardia jiangxiensis]
MPATPSTPDAPGHPVLTLPRLFDLFMRSTDPSKKTVAEIDDDLMVEFFIRWSHFGGGPEEDIMTKFGITKSAYVERLHTLAHSKRIDRYPLGIARTLKTLAMKDSMRRRSPQVTQ